MTNDTYKKKFLFQNIFGIIDIVLKFGLHIFLYCKIKSAFPNPLIAKIWIVWGFFFLLIALITKRNFGEKFEKLLCCFDRIAGLYILYLFILFLTFLLLDALCSFINVKFLPIEIFISALVLALIILVFGIIQANMIQTVYLKIYSEKLSPEVPPLRIVQITDLHLGFWSGESFLKKIVTKINQLNADMVVVTGDLLDGVSREQNVDLSLFCELKTTFGIYAVTGNHEHYRDSDSAIALMESVGITVLKSESIEVGGIIIVGVSDADHTITENWGLSRSETLVLSLEHKQKDKFLLLLRHKPIIESGTEGHFDLQLSGHTHGGQFFPSPFSRHIISGINKGFKKFKKGELLYVSNGVGHIGPPFRFFAPPEIVVIDLRTREDEARI